ncbi:MAG: hypothetical protein C3F07_06695 [Anaerolineales bacterium]|nr:O-antigen ligase family protein [Anaerolineae bacterium]PWB74914.1 MAG: hypothetical protein C3F07_06695 [Anaerolineales bacterium]
MNIDINLKLPFLHKKITIGWQWIQFGIIATVLLASAVISYWGSMQIKMLIPALLGGIVMLLLLLKQINIGYILLMLAGIFVPFSGPGGINATVIVSAMLIGLWLMDMLVVKRQFRFVRSRALLPVIVFIVISVIAFGMGQLPWFLFANQAPLDSQIGGFTIFLLSSLLLLATANLIRDIMWLKIIVWTFIGLGAIYVFGRLLRLPVDRFYNWAFTAGSMFWTWLVALSFSQIVFNRELKKTIKGLLVLIVLVTFYVAIIQAYDWKSGWVPPLVVVAVIIGLRYPRLVVLSIPVAIIAVGYLAMKLIATDEYSWGTRVDAWIIVLAISRESPLLGLGFSNYYFYTPLFPIRGWNVSFNSHSQYVDLIAQVGMLGLACFFWIFFEVGRLGWNLTNKLTDGFARSYSYGVLAGLIGTLVAAFLVDWVLPFVYNIGFAGFRASVLPWIFMGGLVALENISLGKQLNIARRMQ